MNWLIVAAWLFLGGVAVGYLFDRWRERRFWRRAFLKVRFSQAPMLVHPPTVTELRHPIWLPGPCPTCGGESLSELAFAEHMRTRHGDS